MNSVDRPTPGAGQRSREAGRGEHLQRRLSPERVREFLNPASVALVGATDKFRMSVNVNRNLRLHGFRGGAFAVNPRRDTVYGRPAVPDLGAINEPVGLAFIFFGGDRVIDTVEEAAQLGIRNVVIMSSGFGEAGPEGRERQRRLVELADANDVVIMGPNTIGFVNVAGSVALYGSPCADPIPRGVVGVASQSGMMLRLTATHLADREIGFSSLVAVGNEAALSLNDVIDFYVDDPGTSVIALFLESVRDAAGFRAAAERALDAGKPIVALSGARTEATAATALSHTGAMVGSQAVNAAALSELGVIAVTSLEDYLSTVALLASRGPLPGRRLAYVSLSGGRCELFADRAAELGFTLPAFATATRDELRRVLPDFAANNNPLDCTGAGDTSALVTALGILSQDDGLDLLLYDSGIVRVGTSDPAVVAANVERFGQLSARSPRPVVPIAMLYGEAAGGGSDFPAGSAAGTEIGGVEHGLSALSRSAWWSQHRDEAARTRPEAAAPRPENPTESGERSGVGEGMWTEARALDALRARGIPAAPYRLCRDRGDLRSAAAELAGPLVLKVSSPDIAHKSAAGGVRLGVTGEAAALAAFDEIMAAVAEAVPGARIDGVLAMPLREQGLELIAGVKRDPVWGLVLMVGFGGVWADVLADTAICLLPTTPQRIALLLGGLRGARLFGGGYGLPPTDVDLLGRHVARIADAALSYGDELDSLEINPLWVRGDQMEALDALITWRRRA